MKHLLGIEDLSPEEIETILHTADSMLDIANRRVKRVPTLSGCAIINVFLEPSTRTRCSFELAAKRLSADLVNFTETGNSSLSKGETISDMARNLEAMQADAIVVRGASGVPHKIAEHVSVPVINAGDGTHEHPTQALLNALTVQQEFGTLKGQVITIVGDIQRSRVAGSDVRLFTKMGAEVRLCGPPYMLPDWAYEEYGVTVTHNLNEALCDADVVEMLRIQHERDSGINVFNEADYIMQYRLDKGRMHAPKEDAIILHPGPINRDIEITDDVADGSQSRILKQVRNGVAIRMAVLYLLTGEK